MKLALCAAVATTLALTPLAAHAVTEPRNAPNCGATLTQDPDRPAFLTGEVHGGPIVITEERTPRYGTLSCTLQVGAPARTPIPTTRARPRAASGSRTSRRRPSACRRR
jgi:hypothetical protein